MHGGDFNSWREPHRSDVVRLSPALSPDLVIAPESLDHALDDVIDGLTEEIESRGVTIAVAGRGALPPVMADPRGLRTVITNILTNAICFSPPGGTIRVAVRQNYPRTEIEVTDEGEGVDPDDIPRLFLPFEQGENALTRRSEGAGLGLPIAQLYCKAMDGSLAISSSQGRGLTAVINLPVG